MSSWLGTLPLLLLLGIACSSATREPTGGVLPDAGATGSSGAPNAAGGHSGASTEQAGEASTVAGGQAGAGQTPEAAGASGAAGSPEVADAGPTWPDCAGTWAICDGPDADGKPLGYGYACQVPTGYGTHYQMACQYYCDTDANQGTPDPDRKTRCEAAGGQCTCLSLGTLDDAGNVDDSGPCSNRYACQPR